MNDRPNRAREPRIKLLAFDDIQLGREPRYLVQGLIPRVGVSVIWGPPKSGKSFWTFDLSMHVALGWEYRGRRVQQGPVVYCAFEGQSGIRARVEAFRLRFLAERSDAVPFFLEPLTLDLVQEVNDLIAAIRDTQISPAAIVLDTLNRSLRGSENSDEDMGAYVAAAEALREAFECAVLIVHHCGIDGTRPRGHTSLRGAVAAQIAVKRDASDYVIVTVEEMRDGPEGGTIASILDTVEVGQDSDGEPITSCVVVPTEITAGQDKTRATGAAKVALDLLRRAIVDAGERPPACNHIPPDIHAVRLTLWRRYCYEGSIAGADTQEARQKAFSRASQKLQSIGAIGNWSEWVWPA